ncbi:hypothetical protein HK405_015125, partial [Cladochytrium tenue]
FEAATLKFPANFDVDDGVPQYKKQIIGFAKFRTRFEAMQARDRISGRKVDAERGCILKAEIAKKNLHTKRGIPNEFNPTLLANPIATQANQLPPAGTTAAAAFGGNTVGGFPSSNGVVGNLNAGPIRRVLNLNTKEGPSGYGDLYGRVNSVPFSPNSAGSTDTPTASAPPISLEYFSSPPTETETMMAAPNRRQSPTSEATLAEFGQSRQSSDLENRPNMSILGRSFLDSPRYDPFPDLLDGGVSLTKVVSPPRSMSTPFANSEQRGFSSALFSSETLLSDRFPSLSINTKIVSFGLNSSSGLASAPQNGLSSFNVAEPVIMGANSGGSPTNYGPGYRSLADQNPPCNTLYVGNLPPNTNENELRDLFSRSLGYKRMSYRSRPNGPVCFVEFDDVQFAQLALNDLHGTPLSNSIKGGIRLR